MSLSRLPRSAARQRLIIDVLSRGWRIRGAMAAFTNAKSGPFIVVGWYRKNPK